MDLSQIPESFNQNLVRFDCPSGHSVMLRRMIPRRWAQELRRPLREAGLFDELGNVRNDLSFEQRELFERNGNEWLAAYIASWSYKGPDGDPLPVTAENVGWIGDDDYGPINVKIGELRQGRSDAEEKAFPAPDERVAASNGRGPAEYAAAGVGADHAAPVVAPADWPDA